MIPASQSVEDRFNDNEAWMAMKRELEPQAANILQQFSIAKVLTKVCTLCSEVNLIMTNSVT